MSDDAERARRYLLDGDPSLALGTCEGALRDADVEAGLGLRLLAARAAAGIGDVGARLKHLEAAEGLVREHRLSALGPVLLQLGETHLQRDEPGRAALALEEALEHLEAEDPGRERAQRVLEEARRREAEGDEDPDEPAPTLDPAESAPVAATERLLAMVDRLLEADPDMDLSALLDLILAELVSAVNADRGFMLLEEPGEGLVIRAARDAKGGTIVDPAREVSRKIAERAAAESIALRAVRPAEDPRFAGSRSAKALDLRALVAAPLRYRRVDMGSVLLDRRGPGDPAFDDAAEALVTRFAKIASSLIVRTRRRDTEKRRKEAMEDLFLRAAEQVRDRFDVAGFIGTSEVTYKLLRFLERIAPTDSRVMIRGESGTGKELIARTIHRNSLRKTAPFHAVNCGALAETLLEAELFGHTKGAFTGADADKAGLFERADTGTLLLDEIGDASPRLQAELLRVLQEGEVRRVGDARTRKVDVRVLAATHQNLEAMVAEGRFREDLFFRLNVVEVRVPPLRERPEDIPLLAAHFAKSARDRLPDPSQATPLDEPTLAKLRARRFPGNVRELENVVTRFVMVGELGPESALDVTPRGDAVRAALGEGNVEVLSLRELERRAIVRALRLTGGSRKEAASLLQIGRRTLYNKLKAYGLE